MTSTASKLSCTRSCSNAYKCDATINPIIMDDVDAGCLLMLVVIGFSPDINWQMVKWIASYPMVIPTPDSI